MEKTSKHQAVLPEAVIEYLNVRAGETYLDATFGGGGHTTLILEHSAPDGQVIGLDRDGRTDRFAEKIIAAYPKRFRFYHLSYDRLEETNELFDGILFDLGFSSDQIEESGRGFSFMRHEPLDLRFDDRGGQTAAQLLMQATPERLARIFQEYAEDRHAKGLATKIVTTRRLQPIRTTTDFVNIVGTKQPSVLAPLFQALRIEVNDELQTLQRGLIATQKALKPAGRLVVISFHSLEDRMVKEFVKTQMKPLTKKPVLPSEAEIVRNPRSRSAKLRAAINE